MNDVKLVESQTEPTTKISSKKIVLISIGVTVLLLCGAIIFINGNQPNILEKSSNGQTNQSAMPIIYASDDEAPRLNQANPEILQAGKVDNPKEPEPTGEIFFTLSDDSKKFGLFSVKNDGTGFSQRYMTAIRDYNVFFAGPANKMFKMENRPDFSGITCLNLENNEIVSFFTFPSDLVSNIQVFKSDEKGETIAFYTWDSDKIQARIYAAKLVNKLWNLKEITKEPIKKTLTCFFLTPDGSSIIYQVYNSKSICKINLNSKSLITEESSFPAVPRVNLVSHDGAMFACVTVDDQSSNPFTASYHSPSNITGIRVHKFDDPNWTRDYQVENIKSGTDISFHKWSHDGNSIYFSFICELEEYPRMYRLFLDSGSFVHITEMKMDGN